MINTTLHLPKDAEGYYIDIPTVLPCIPPIGTDIYINNEQHELEEMYTIEEVTYSIHDHTMSVYLKEYKPRKL